MEFKKQKPIYLQIADTLCDRIAVGEWKEQERIASLRDIGAELGVNPNTVLRTYDFLQQNDIIYNQRGMGYFVCKGACSRIRTLQQQEFIHEVWPDVLQRIQRLGLSIDDLMNPPASKV